MNISKTSRFYSRSFTAYAALLFVVLVALAGRTPAANTYYWYADAPDGNWKRGADGARWTGGLWDEPPSGGGTILRFDNNGWLNMTNNVSGYSVNQLFFGTGASQSRVITGNALQFWDDGGTDPKIENQSSVTQTVNLNLTGDNNDPLQLNPVNGDLTIGGAINNNGSWVEVWGENQKLLTLNGAVSGNGGLAIKQYSKVDLKAANSYSGGTVVEKGELWVNEGGSFTGGLTIGDSTQQANVTKFFISDADGGTTVGNNITVTNGNASTRYIGALNTSGENTISGNVAMGAETRFEVVESGGTLAVSGAISGANNLIKIGGGILKLSSASTDYSGSTTVDTGTIALSGSGTLAGSSGIYVGTGATFDISGVTTSTTVKGIAEQGTDDGGSIKLGSKGLTVSGGSGTYQVNNLGVAGDTGTFTLNDGDTTIRLYGASQYTGKTTLTAGTLTIDNTHASTEIELNGGNLTTEDGGNLAAAASVTVGNASSTLTLGANEAIGSFAMTAGEIAGAYKLTASTYALNGGTINSATGLGTGAATASSGTTALNGTIDGSLAVSGGTVNLGASDRIGGGVTISSGTLGMSTYNDSVSTFQISGGSLGGSGTLTSSGGYDLQGGTVTANLGSGTATASVGTTALNGNLAGALVANSGGTVNLGGTVGGNVTVSGGTVNLGSANRIDNSAAVSISSGTLGLSSYSDQVGSFSMSGGTLSGTGVLTAATYAFSGSGDMTVSSGLGAGALTKTGAGTLLINNGKTANVTSSSIEGGKLVVSGTLAGATTITNGATIGGSGTVGTLNIASGGILAPGNSPGTLTATNGASWIQGGSYDWEIFSLADAPGTSWDWLQVTSGSLDLNGITGTGGFTINLITLSGLTQQGALSGFSPTATYTNWLIASAPTISGFTASDFNLNSSLFVGATGTFNIEQKAYGGGQGLFLTYQGGPAAVPEPGTWAAAAFLAATAGFVRWRRRKQQDA